MGPKRRREYRRPARRLAAAGAAAALLAGAGLAAAAPADQDPIGKISVYAGAWKSRIVHYQTTYTKAHVETTNVRTDCWRSGSYYACDQFIDGRSAAFIVYTYSAAAHVYHIQVIPKDGNLVTTGVMMISGNTWTFPWQYSDKGKTVYIRIVNVFPNRDTIQFHEAFSYDQTHWTTTADGIERRVASR